MEYHLRRTEREIRDEEEIRSIIEQGTYAVVGLARDNEPYVVSLSYAYDPELNALFFHCAKEGLKLEFLGVNNRACATIIDDDGYQSGSCDHAYKTLILRGTMVPVDDPQEVDRALRLLVTHLEKHDVNRFMSKLHPENKGYQATRVLRMTITEITGKARGCAAVPQSAS